MMRRITSLVVLAVVLALPSLPVLAQPPGVQITCEDQYEPNNQANQASNLVMGVMYAAICPKNDVDVYRIDVVAGERLSFTLAYPRSDFNLYLYSSKQSLQIGRSENSDLSQEKITWTSNQADTLYVLVQGRGGTGTYFLWTESSLHKGVPLFRPPVSGVGEGITTPIGSIKHTGPDRYALDYAWDEEGVDVYPIMEGRVVYSGCRWNDYGCTVVVRHWDDTKWDRKYYSIYAHLQNADLPAVGSLVDGNRPIGHMGRTGTGSNNVVHLHFAVRVSDQAYDGLTALYGQGMTGFDPRPRFY